ncbi:hypothetical protein, partial [Mesorhizobium sp. M8A.F.Ca.ET.165.01.1.1]
LLDNFPHPDAGGQNVINLTGINVVATDSDGDQASATVQVNVTDDVPTAVADTDSVTEGGTASGNVITGVGSDGNAAGADTKGADGAAVSGVTGSGATT